MIVNEFLSVYMISCDVILIIINTGNLILSLCMHGAGGHVQAV